MPFAKFMQLALYHPEVGYYRRNRQRIGRDRSADFFTSTSSGPIFGELVATACAKRLREAGRDPRAHTFVEIGAERGRSVLDGVNHPFAGVRSVGVDDEDENEDLGLSGECVVFSNELFDAQPCMSTISRDGMWSIVGVRLEGERLTEVELENRIRLPIPGSIPAAPDGYRFDCPTGATFLAERIVKGPWLGLFVAIDYGKTLRELVEETPTGTARAYYRHTQSNDLLARPGEQDLTCHICWDWLSETLTGLAFESPTLEFQEAFFLRQAADSIAAISRSEAARFSQRKMALFQLLHPAHLGQKFQVLHALR